VKVDRVCVKVEAATKGVTIDIIPCLKIITTFDWLKPCA
jgi:hypothetical protein